jgi:hypothetical protein
MKFITVHITKMELSKNIKKILIVESQEQKFIKLLLGIGKFIKKII